MSKLDYVSKHGAIDTGLVLSDQFVSSDNLLTNDECKHYIIEYRVDGCNSKYIISPFTYHMTPTYYYNMAIYMAIITYHNTRSMDAITNK